MDGQRGCLEGSRELGRHLDLLRSLPRARRDVAARRRVKSPVDLALARRFGAEYFDGDRRHGYGGYVYDGRWRSVALDVIYTYSLGPGARVLDVGCAKGFLVYDMLRAGLDSYGLDVSWYAVRECPHPGVVGRLHYGSADYLPFPDDSFDLVLSINTLHNLPREELVFALREVQRVSRGGMFVAVDSYRTAEERAAFDAWVLTAETHGAPEFWLELFAQAGYEGDYAWTIASEEG